MRSPRSHKSDLELVHAARAGRAYAQRDLARRLLPTINAVVRGMVSNPNEREDLVQQSALACLQSVRGYRGTSSLTWWARRVAMRQVIDARAARRRHDRHTTLSAAVELAEHHAPPDLSHRAPRPLEDYLHRLSDEQRSALLLRYGFGYSLKEIAELVDASADTVKYRITTARSKIRGWIRRDEAIGTGRLEGLA